MAEVASDLQGGDARQILAAYLTELNTIRASGAGVPETSYYPALSHLFNAVGRTLTPKIYCILQLGNQGAGQPDGGLYTADQVQPHSDGRPKDGQKPARGAIEAKGTKPDIKAIAFSTQVKNYLGAYGIVIATNLREFMIVTRGHNGGPEPMEVFSLANNEQDFWNRIAALPHEMAKVKGAQFIEFIRRACLHNAPLNSPKDVAWFLASYARDALFRVEQRKDLPALQSVRSALEESLGMKFVGEKGEHFFRSTLVQTLFYGVFSAWVRWHKDNPIATAKFEWRTAEWSLHVPFIRTLYEAVATRGRLEPLGLVEVLDWTAGVLNRVTREEFFQRFAEDHAVQYFYEPFLQAYDPELRKALGVWYTPPEIVEYQVARVDRVLREELDLPDGLADPNVIVLDPCCGTGAYLVEVLKLIGKTLDEKGGGALVASDLKEAAIHRVFGFEIMPAPFVVAHLQLGLLLQNAGAPLSHRRGERVGVYLTNALTGWEPPVGAKQQVMWPELQEEKDAAEQVKREKKILVILGNPPYNAFAGVSPQEEQGLVEPYKKDLNKPVSAGGWGIKKFNLDDLYVRFFRLAERRIAEMSGRGVVSFISNYSWISEPSFVVLRQHLLGSFDKFWIENLHGNRKISEYAPDGKTSETIFAIRGFSAGIQQGVATSLWVKNGKPRRTPALVRFRDDLNDARAEQRRKSLLNSLTTRKFNAAYNRADPRRENRFSFRPEDVAAQYGDWPNLIELCAVAPFNGPVERRGNSLIRFAADAKNMESLRAYLDPKVDDQEMRRIEPRFMFSSGEFHAEETRRTLKGKIQYQPRCWVRYPFKPFDVRFAYLDAAIQPLFSRPSPQLLNQRFSGNAFFITRDTADKSPEGTPFFYSSLICDYDSISGHARHFPIQLRNGSRLEKEAEATLFAALGEKPEADEPVANLSAPARDYLRSIKITNPDADRKTAGLIWMHALAIGYSRAYLKENADGVRRDWPRIPLPATRKTMEASAALGEQIAALLDTETEVPGVTGGKLAPLFKKIGLIARAGGGQLNEADGDFLINAGWGHAGREGVTMPGKGKLAERIYDPDEASAIETEAAAHGMPIKRTRQLLGEKTCDLYLNASAYWRNIPLNVWEYYMGGYQVIKKWLSYREDKIIGRALTLEETREVTNMARRIAAIILLQPKLDENYRNAKAAAFEWQALAHPQPRR